MNSHNHTQSPLLAGIEGKFNVEGDSLELAVVEAGKVNLASGFLVIADPFAQMERSSNLGILLPKGDYAVVVTQLVPDPQKEENNLSHFFTPEEAQQPSIYSPEITAQLAENQASELTKGGKEAQEQSSSEMMMTEQTVALLKDLKRKNVNAYLTIIVEPVKWQQRLQWSQAKYQQGDNCSPPKGALRYLYATQDGKAPTRVPEDFEMYVGVGVDSGNCAVVDEQNLQQLMPPDQHRTRWGETIFDNGQPSSWFNILDGDKGYEFKPGTLKQTPEGIANIELDKSGEEKGNHNQLANIIICESGYGDGNYPIIGEYEFNLDNPEAPLEAKPTLIAIHVSFQVVNEDVDYPVASNSGVRNLEFNAN